jgi:hypothetical protein
LPKGYAALRVCVSGVEPSPLLRIVYVCVAQSPPDCDGEHDAYADAD